MTLRTRQAVSALFMTGLVIALLIFNAWLVVRARLDKESLKESLRKIIPNEFDLEDISVSASGTVQLKNLIIFAQKRPENAQPQDARNMGKMPMPQHAANPPTHVAARETILEAPLAIVKVDILSLIGGKTSVKSVELREPTLRFRQLEDGSWVAGEFFRSLSRAAGAQAPPAATFTNATLLLETEQVFSKGHVQEFKGCEISLRPVGPSRLVVEGKCDAGELGRWTVGGQVDAVHKGFELSLKTEGFVMSDKVGALLAPDLAGAWGNYRPQGPAAISAGAERAPGEDSQTHFVVDLTLGGVAITCKGFPYEISDARGAIRFRKEGADMYGLKGRSGAMSMNFSGHTIGYDTDAGFELDINLHNIALDEKLYQALDPKSREIWDTFAPAGNVNAVCEVVREFGNDKPVVNNMDVTCLNVSARVRDFPYKVAAIEGELRFTPGAIKIHKLRSREGDRIINIEGVIESLDTQPAFDILVAAENMKLDEPLRAACDAETQRVWDTLAPKGTVDLAWNARKTAVPDSTTQHNVKIKCKGVAACHKDFAFPLEAIEGDVVFDGQRITLDRLKGRNGEATVEVSGYVSVKDEEKPLALEVKGKNLQLTEQTVKTFPTQIREMVEGAKLSGNLDFTARLERRRTKEKEAADAVTSYLAEVVLSECTMDVGMGFSGISGKVTMRGAQGLPPESMFGSLRLNSLAVQGKRFSEISGQFLYANDLLTFNDIRAGAYDGLITGYFRIDTKSKEFDSSGSLLGLDLKEYVRDTHITGKQMSGKMDGAFTIKGKGSDASQLWGEGKLTLDNGYLWDVPLFLEMVNLFSLKKRQPFTEGSARLKIRGRNILVREVQFSNEDITMLGTGRIDFDGNQLLRFKTRFSTSILPSIFLLTQAWELIRDNIAMVEATGTFNEPKLSIKPLPSVFSPLDEDDSAPQK